jgi:hypothetical protein
MPAADHKRRGAVALHADELPAAFRGGEVVTLESLGCALEVDAIYFDPLAG